MGINLKGVRKHVFFPTFFIFVGFVVSFFLKKSFVLNKMESIQQWILNYFDWGFTLLAFVTFISCLAVYFSPIRNVKIGGQDAEPLLSKWNWFTISLCTTIAVGILFWAPAEPLYHYHQPPSGHLKESELFAVATMYLHWSFTPYSIYMVPALVLALMVYNCKRPNKIGSAMEPIFGEKSGQRYSYIFDVLCLFALVTGVSASLASGILLLTGALDSIFGIEPTALVKTAVCLMIVGTFVVSATSGLMKGILLLSDINTKVLILIAGFIFIFGPSVFIITVGYESFIFYVKNFLSMSIIDSISSQDIWYKKWTVFYWSVWLAWAPMAGFFLARIARGYTIKEMIQINFFVPSLLTCLWMSIFAGTSLYMDNEYSSELFNLLNAKGPESVIYSILEHLPFATISKYCLLFIIFLSFVTAADSSTDIMSTVCSRKLSHQKETKTSLWLKVVWGLSMGIIAWISSVYTGVDGLRMLSNIGGLPALFVVSLMTVSLWILVIRNKNYFAKS